MLKTIKEDKRSVEQLFAAESLMLNTSNPLQCPNAFMWAISFPYFIIMECDRNPRNLSDFVDTILRSSQDIQNKVQMTAKSMLP